MAAIHAYPVHVDADLDSRLSRWLWLVKWFLAIPHYVVLALLWPAFIVLSLVAFVAILITGRYPRGIFAFNVGVLRWHWRVAYYAYAALGTDRYPPFTLAEVPDYPAHLSVDPPGQMSRGLVLVKWWLLALPHYLITGLFVGGGTWLAWQFGRDEVNWAGGGLIGVLALIAAVVLAVTGRYPTAIFDFVLGLDRWVLRVAVYAALMTDEYPPFRLDTGGHEPTGALTLPRPGPSGGEAAGAGPTGDEPVGSAPVGEAPVGDEPPGTGQRGGWTAGRVVAVVSGSLLALLSLGALTGGGALWWAGQTQRVDGFVTTPAVTYHAEGYALTSEPVRLWTGGPAAAAVLGDVRIRVTATDPGQPIFVGVGPADRVDMYLAGTGHSVIGDANQTRTVPGFAPASPPGDAGIWTASTSGTGTQTVTLNVDSGRWTVVVMNADASAGVHVRADLGATAPALPWIVVGLLVAGVLALAAAIPLIAVPTIRSGR